MSVVARWTARLFLAVGFCFMVGAPALAQSSGWGKNMQYLRPLTPGELANLTAKLDNAAARGFEFTWGRPDIPPPPPERVRLLTMSRRNWHREMANFSGESLPAPSVPEGGPPEIAVSPDVLDPDKPPGEAASVVSHEMGHIADPTSRDSGPDGKPDIQGQMKHFLIYKAELKELCDYIAWLKNEPGDEWYEKLCDICEAYDRARKSANSDIARGANEPEIGKCAACIDCL